MSSAKLYIGAVLLTMMAIGIAGGTAIYIGAKKVQQEIESPDGSVAQVVETFANLDETLSVIRGDSNQGEFGQRMEALRTRYPFSQPADGVITEEQVRKFIAVKSRFLLVDQEMLRDSGSEPNAADLARWNFFSRLKRLRGEQIAALEEAGMSLDEFRFVHGAIYLAIVAEGPRKVEEQGKDWGRELRENAQRSAADIDRELANPETTESRRKELETLRRELDERAARVERAVEAAQSAVESVPQQNIELVKRYGAEIARVMSAGADLDAIEFFRALETSGVEIQ